MKKLTYQISIHAPVQDVWNTMLQPDTYKKWVEVSWPGSFYKGSWKKDARISFVSENGSGTLAEIKEFTPYKTIGAEHIAVLLPGGTEDTTSDIAKGWVGITEQYNFIQRKDETVLEVAITTNPAWEEMFNSGWPNALQKLKEICEHNNN